ncbi:hypothetical protein L3Q82_006576 [Scortum barcoo]|uniref:Uncharacterized protein n=1 Tax=Scortum barcoo TaxID=214431 RepID=A0ACB8WZS8_9TELE|nr:hypothetical protein L3Q82_006576 [Scortum barcoo]
MALLLRAFLPLLLLHFCLLNWSVWAKVELTMHESVEVYLGDSAQIPCQYSFTDANNEPSFVFIQWFVRVVGQNSRIRIFYGDNRQQIVDNNTNYSGRINVTSDQRGSQLTIQDVRLSDEREFFCQVNGLAAGNAEGKTHLRVFAPPEAPVIEGILTGVSVTNEMPSRVASCEARNGFPKPNITWYRNSMPLTPTPGYVNVLTLVTREHSGFYSVQSTLEYKVLKEDKDAQFSCEVSFFVVGAIRTVESSSVNITVHYPTTMVELWKESPQGLVKEGDTVELRCQGSVSPDPADPGWGLRPEATLTRLMGWTHSHELDVNLESRGDVLILTPVSRKDSGIYQCRPLDNDGYTEVKGEVQLTVHYLDPAVVVPKDSEVMLKGEDLTATCNALSSLKTSTVWYKDGKQVGNGNTLHLRDATYETSGEYVCEVTVPSLPALHTTPAAPFTSSSKNWHEVFSRVNEHMILSVVSVKVTSDVSALCNASNDMGTEVKAFSIKAIPRLTSTARFSPAEGSGVIIVVIILCLLLLAFLGSVLYFLAQEGEDPLWTLGETGDVSTISSQSFTN